MGRINLDGGNPMKHVIQMILLLAMVCLIAGCAQSKPVPNGQPTPTAISQDNPIEGSSTASPVHGLKDPAELETFLDDLFTKQMEEYHIAGMTFTMVKDEQVFFQKGYGYADLEKRTPVDPASTLFRIGSVTKLITWTAVMQLAEQGKVNLDADINTYLDFKIPDTFPEPITLKNLMTHTAGFEDRAYGWAVSSEDPSQPLGQFLASHIPARVRPVGQLAAYSNYGAALAGYIVERVSGMPYADYVQTNIFNPLNMDHTTARLPIPPELASQLSIGYTSIPGSIQPGAFEIMGTQAQPAGAISATAADMARFMIAHLNGGQLTGGKETILDAANERLMQTSLWTPDERLTGFAHGFMECVLNGQRILYHSGDTQFFHSLLVLIPNQNLGFFISYNTDTSAGVWMLDLLSFLEHYYPQDKLALQPPDGFDARASRFAGFYRPMRGSYTTIEKADVLKNWIEIKPSGDGALLVGSAFSPGTARLVEVEPLLFREPQYGLTSIFVKDQQENITAVSDLLPAGLPYEKLPWHANPNLHYGLLGVCSVLFLSAILAASAGFLLRRFKKGKPRSQPPFSRASRWLACLVAVLDLVALGIFLVLFIGKGWDAIAYGQMSTIDAMLVAWLAAAVLTIPFIGFTVLAWKNHSWGVGSRVHYTLITIAAVAFVWFLNYWNLLGFRY
jgi:CubicO group peptidase (beta-lactamase class C family)